jgi:hypothetical protein
MVEILIVVGVVVAITLLKTWMNNHYSKDVVEEEASSPTVSFETVKVTLPGGEKVEFNNTEVKENRKNYAADQKKARIDTKLDLVGDMFDPTVALVVEGAESGIALIKQLPKAVSIFSKVKTAISNFFGRGGEAFTTNNSGVADTQEAPFESAGHDDLIGEGSVVEGT